MQERVNLRNARVWIQTWRVYLFLAFLQGGVTLIALLQQPSEAKNVFFLGLSLPRIVTLVFVLAALFGLGWLLVVSWRDYQWTERQITWLASSLNRPKISGVLLLASLFGLAAGSYFVLLVPDIIEPFTRAYFDRLLPVVVWFTGISAQTLIVLPLIRKDFNFQGVKPKGDVFYLLIVIFGLMFLLWNWIAHTSLETERVQVGWYDQGVPILETQIILAWLAGVTIWALLSFIRRDKYHSSIQILPVVLDWIIVLALYLGTVLLWNSIPVTPNWFVSEPRKPNFEHYPNSDALVYDMTAQTLLAGEGLYFAGMPFVRRPMFALFLTTLHAIGGQKYETVVFLQILVLATLPVFIYMLTKDLHNRLSGVIAAVLIALREANSIAIAGNITSSNAKVLMADLPATLGVVCLVYLAIIWLQHMETRKLHGLLAGGLLGISMLIRIELGAMFLAIALFSFIISWRRFSNWLVGIGFFTLGLFLVVSPWIYRNWSLTGQIFLEDSPTFRVDWLMNRYNPGLLITPTHESIEPGELGDASTVREPQATQALPNQVDHIPYPLDSTPMPQDTVRIMDGMDSLLSVASQIGEFVSENSGEVASFIVTHYMNSQIQTFLTLPTTFRGADSLTGFLGHRMPDKLWYECCSLLNYVRRLPYWHKWDGQFPSQVWVPLLSNLALLAFGLSQVWKRHRILGLTPAFVSTLHILINSLVRNSGGRYILPVDWVGMVYYSVGLAQFTTWGINLFTDKRVIADFAGEQVSSNEANIQPKQSIFRSPKLYALSIGLFIIGCLPLVLERSIPPRYDEKVKEEMIQVLMQSELLSQEDRGDLQKLLDAGGLTLAGRALYPRFYPAEVGEPGSKNPMGPLPFSRLGFYLSRPEGTAVVMPLEKPPSTFPNASNILVVGCPSGETLAVAVFEVDNSLREVIVPSPTWPIFGCLGLP